MRLLVYTEHTYVRDFDGTISTDCAFASFLDGVAQEIDLVTSDGCTSRGLRFSSVSVADVPPSRRFVERSDRSHLHAAVRGRIRHPSA